MSISSAAVTPAPNSSPVDIAALLAAYYTAVPDPSVPAQRVAFGTSGHRGSPLASSFNEAHVLALTQAICLYRARNGLNGPLFHGLHTHAISGPAITPPRARLPPHGAWPVMPAAVPAACGRTLTAPAMAFGSSKPLLN